MTWVRLSDGFFNDPKVIAVGEDAATLYLSGLCYCSANLTDGVIPKRVLARLTTRRRVAMLSQRLVDSGMWIDHDTYILVAHYLEHQSSKAQVEASRASARARKQRERHGPVTEMSRRDIARTDLPVTPMSRLSETDIEIEAEPSRFSVVPVPRADVPKPRRPADKLKERIQTHWPDLPNWKTHNLLHTLRSEQNIADMLIDSAIGQAIERQATNTLNDPLAYIRSVAIDWYQQRANHA